MPSTSHRKCQYQGPNCQGTAHAGFDQCARCYFDHVKPALRAERQEMKRRRAIKKGTLVERPTSTLTPENRKLINEMDLKEPLPLMPGQILKHAIRELEIDRMVAGKTDEQRIETLVNEAIRLELADVPTTIYPITRKETTAQPSKEEPKPTVSRTTAKRPPLTDEQKTEIVEMYRSGLPTPEIEATYKIGSQTLYTLVRRAGVPLRGQPGQKYQPPRVASVAPPVEPTKDEPAPMLETPPNGAVASLPVWTVVYTVIRTETKTVHAETFNDAAAQIGNLDPNVEVISVSKVRP